MSRKFQNTGGTEAVFIKIQTGEYFGEDDIERLADYYGRV
jgi:mannose-6-phosphate isomerase